MTFDRALKLRLKQRIRPNPGVKKSLPADTSKSLPAETSGPSGGKVSITSHPARRLI